MILSIIIVNLNTKNLLRDCLSSIYESDLRTKYEIFVVDNGSKDDSVKMVRANFPNVDVIANEVNLGFSKANNQAIKRCKGKYILLLNPDTVVNINTLEKMVSFMDNNKDIGILGPKIQYPDGNVQLTCARNFPDLLIEFFNVSKLAKIFPKNKLFGSYLMGYWNHLDSREVNLLSGACMLIKKEVFKDIGLLDESFFMFYDDVDFCYRAKMKGYKIYYYADTSIIHHGGASWKETRENMQKTKLISYQSMYKYYYKTRSRLYAEAVKIMMILNLVAFFAAHILIFSMSHGKRRYKEKQTVNWYLNLIKFFLYFHHYHFMDGHHNISRKNSR